jgi:ATP-dependent Clp protease ATP-binding subunit ClpC
MTLKFPVAVWQDAEGSYTARVLDGAVAAAIDTTAAAALEQLKRYLAWGLRNEVAIGSSDLADLELRDWRIRVRPEYRTDESVFPVATVATLRVTCVHGRRQDGTRHCVIPTLDLRFSYQPGDPVEQLVTEMLQQALGKKTPQELSRELMPGRIWLDAVHVRSDKATRRAAASRFAALESVAELLGRQRRGSRHARAIQRDSEVRQVAGQLAAGKFNLLLVGESGVGKTTVLVEAIRQYLRERREALKSAALAKVGDLDSVLEAGRLDLAPDALAPQRQFWLTSGQRLIAGMRYLGQWEERCEQVIDELGETGSVLCVDDLLELVRVGGLEPGSGVAAFLMPYLQRGELRLVAEATPSELDACRRLLPGLADLFQIVQIREFSPADARAVLSKLLEEGARNHKLELEPGLADVIYRLFKRFQPYAAFPGRSATFVRQLLDEASRAEGGCGLQSKPQARASVTQADVLTRFQRETGLPERLLRDDLPLPHEEVLASFRGAVLGQEAACQAAAGVVTALKTGLSDPGRPLGVMLFCGPTGVGKTEMAKALARYLFGAGEGGSAGKHSDRLIRLDMSEYAGYGAAQRLLMAADGGVSDFLKRVRRQPFTVVLFDEIEKAAAEVHDALLGVLDEGRLSDRFGRTTTFKSAVIVMTSNLGAERSAPVGFDPSVQPAFERIAMGTFRPEFFNRIDAVVTFQPLARETIAALARRELEALARRDGLVKARLRLLWSEDVVNRLAAAGYDARYGARPLLRALDRLVVAPLSHWLLAHPDARDAKLSLAISSTGTIEIRVV